MVLRELSEVLANSQAMELVPNGLESQETEVRGTKCEKSKEKERPKWVLITPEPQVEIIFLFLREYLLTASSVDPDAVPGSRLAVPAPPTLRERLDACERDAIEQALALSRQNKTRAARALGVSRPLLYRRIKELGIADVEADDDPIARPGPPPDPA